MLYTYNICGQQEETATLSRLQCGHILEQEETEQCYILWSTGRDSTMLYTYNICGQQEETAQCYILTISLINRKRQKMLTMLTGRDSTMLYTYNICGQKETAQCEIFTEICGQQEETAMLYTYNICGQQEETAQCYILTISVVNRKRQHNVIYLQYL